ncbi:MAG: hypothetical protein FWD53_01010 [Phycisphaerales bacterium]|nr:hypothetical protein [Phycisphaerales bacterium]
MMILLFGSIGAIVCLTMEWTFGLFCGTPLVMFAGLFYLFSRPTPLHLLRKEYPWLYADPVPWKHCGNGWKRSIGNSDGQGAFDYYFVVALLLAIGMGSLTLVWLLFRGEMVKEESTYVFLPFVIGGVTMLIGAAAHKASASSNSTQTTASSAWPASSPKTKTTASS